MKFFPIVFFLLAVAAAEALGEICNSQQTPTKLIARRTWPSQTATTTAKPTTDTTTASPKSTTTAELSTVSTTSTSTTTSTAVPPTTSTTQPTLSTTKDPTITSTEEVKLTTTSLATKAETTTQQSTSSPTTETTSKGQATTSTPSSTTQVETTTTTSIPSTTPSEVASSSTLSTTTKTTPTPSGPILFNCSVDNPACGNMCTDLTSAGGVVQSPNYPGDYGSENKNCRVTIVVPVGWMIQLKFNTFNLEFNKADIWVDDGVTNLLPRISSYTIPVVIPATINEMNINFLCSTSSKPSTAIYNWQATFSVTSQGSSCYVHNPACGNMCNNVTSAGSGVVQSPNFPGDYGKETRSCPVTIVVPAGKRIQLTFTTFNLETGKAFIFVRDRTTTYLNRVTGSTIPAVVTTASNIMYIQFSISASTKPTTATYNWQATYTAV